jgi:hypothetical protein
MSENVSHDTKGGRINLRKSERENKTRLRTIKGMEDKTPSKVEGAIQRLNQDPYLLAAITAVPVVGGSITQVLTGIGQQIVQERNAKLFQQLSEHLAEVDEQTIKQDYFGTPEGFDLLIKAMDESRRTRSDVKRDLIARILTGAVLDYERGEYSPEEYLYLISDLTERELMVASSLYKARPTWESSFKRWASKTSKELGLGTSALEMILARLEARGLVSKSELAAFDVSGYSPENWKYAPTKSIITISPMFRKLMDFLELRG